jgi:hypothetical protein
MGSYARNDRLDVVMRTTPGAYVVRPDGKTYFTCPICAGAHDLSAEGFAIGAGGVVTPTFACGKTPDTAGCAFQDDLTLV